MAELVVLKGLDELRRVALAESVLTIGRSDSNDVVLKSARASRQHARIVPRGQHYYLEDCGSTHGCTVEDRRVMEHRLADGDVVSIADHRLVFLSRAGSTLPELDPLPESEDSWGQVDANQESSWDIVQSVLIDPEKSQEAARKLQGLFEISRILDEAKDFKAVLVQIMDKALSIMGGERGLLMLTDPDGELRVHVARDRNGDITGVERERVSRSLIDKVLETGKPTLVSDAQAGEWTTASVMAYSIHSAICAPLASREVVTGVIYVDHTSRAHAFDKRDLAFFTTLAVQAKAAIDASRAFWELVDSLFRASDDFIVVCSTDGVVTQANRAAGKLMGLEPDELRNRRLEDLVVSDDRENAAQLAELTAERDVMSGRELRLAVSGQREVPLSISSFALRDHLGKAIGVCVIGRDMTELKALIHKLTQANEFIRATFGRYLSDEIVESLLETPQGLELGGEKRRVTILTSDLRGFTAVAERLRPETVVRILNNYLGTMVEVIAKHQGTIDEFMGDAILVFFGAPIQREDDALRAAACAVEMQLAMETVNEQSRQEGLPELQMGIALNTGDVVAGNIGSQRRSKYAVVGTDVNVVYRIESNTVGGQILLTQNTVDAAGGQLLLGRQLALNVKGVKGTLQVHELLGVGGRYDLRLREESDVLVRAEPEIEVRVAELEGKQVSSELWEGWIDWLGPRSARIRTSRALDPLTNLKLSVLAEGGRWLDELYAKVAAETAVGSASVEIRFTSVPPEVRDFLDSRRPA